MRDFKFIVLDYKKDLSTLKVKYTTNGLNPKVKMVRVPSEVLFRQDPNEIRSYIVKEAPMEIWDQEEKLKAVKPSQNIQSYLNREFDVTATEYDSIVNVEVDSSNSASA